MRGLRQALLFLTRIPVGQLQVDASGWGDSLNYFPIVGLIIGVLLWFLAMLLAPIDPQVSAVLILVFWVVLTGALHLDGLADSVDAWVGGIGDRARTLEIMQDPNCGAMGVVSLVLVLLLKYVALVLLLEMDLAAVLIVIPIWTRSALIWVFVTTTYARESGLAQDIINHFSIHKLIWILPLSMLLPMFLLHGGLAWLMLSLLGLLCLLWRRAVLRRLNGFTGDTLGALLELSEAALLILAALMV